MLKKITSIFTIICIILPICFGLSNVFAEDDSTDIAFVKISYYPYTEFPVYYPTESQKLTKDKYKYSGYFVEKNGTVRKFEFTGITDDIVLETTNNFIVEDYYNNTGVLKSIEPQKKFLSMISDTSKFVIEGYLPENEVQEQYNKLSELKEKCVLCEEINKIALVTPKAGYSEYFGIENNIEYLGIRGDTDITRSDNDGKIYNDVYDIIKWIDSIPSNLSSKPPTTTAETTTTENSTSNTISTTSTIITTTSTTTIIPSQQTLTQIYGIKINLQASDPNNDNSIDSADATCILIDYANRLAESKNYKYYTLEQADSNDDGKVDSADATIILIYYANEMLKK